VGVVVVVVSLVVVDSGGHVVSVVVEGGLQSLNLYPIIIELIESTLKLPEIVAIEKSVPVGW
jgi:hypothetical protein